jgi:serine protease Do
MKRLSLIVVCVLCGLIAGGYFAGPWLQGQGVNPVNTSIPKEFASYRDVVKKVLPAVVSVEAQMKVVRTKARQAPARPQLPDGIPEEFRRFFEDFDFPEIPRQGFGSGFFIDPNGVILTNFHVVEGAEQVTVTLHDGRKFTSKDIHADRRTDLAIVRLSAKGPFPYLELGDSDGMEIGDRVLAIGAPFGLAGSVTHGIISAKGRNGLNMNFYEDFLQTDAAINPGNSGGPLLSLDGKAIGINAAIKSRSGGWQGVGLAVASNLAKRVTQALLKDGVVQRGYLGVQVRDLAPEVAQRLNVPGGAGVVIGDVNDNTPAAKAKLKPGDIITALAGKPVKDGKALQEVVLSLPINKPAEVSIVRDGQAIQVSVLIEEQPQDFGYTRLSPQRTPGRTPVAVPLDKIGVALSDLTPEMAEEMGYHQGTRGVVITIVDSGSIAWQAGLRRGMLITKVENQAVASATEARDLVQKASLQRGVLLQVQSPRGGTTFVLLRSEA